MNITAINQLVSHGWTLEVWEARYGGDVWAMIGPAAYVDQLRDITGGGDIEAVELEWYLDNKGSWIPAAQAKNVGEALNKLENKIELLVDNNEWKDAVHSVCLRIIEVSDGSYGLKTATNDLNEKTFCWPQGI
ncbi:hypothetical protein [Paenibacillus sp. 1A_MP2]|uniref:hypothetical protein n=1 Tax=Paenibacillus sp. 1A_MP2 TaxID=3457495 RepID=UPI003FCD75D8